MSWLIRNLRGWVANASVSCVQESMSEDAVTFRIQGLRCTTWTYLYKEGLVYSSTRPRNVDNFRALIKHLALKAVQSRQINAQFEEDPVVGQMRVVIAAFSSFILGARAETQMTSLLVRFCAEFASHERTTAWKTRPRTLWDNVVLGLRCAIACAAAEGLRRLLCGRQVIAPTRRSQVLTYIATGVFACFYWRRELMVWWDLAPLPFAEGTELGVFSVSDEAIVGDITNTLNAVTRTIHAVQATPAAAGDGGGPNPPAGGGGAPGQNPPNGGGGGPVPPAAGNPAAAPAAAPAGNPRPAAPQAVQRPQPAAAGAPGAVVRGRGGGRAGRGGRGAGRGRPPRPNPVLVPVGAGPVPVPAAGAPAVPAGPRPWIARGRGGARARGPGGMDGNRPVAGRAMTALERARRGGPLAPPEEAPAGPGTMSSDLIYAYARIFRMTDVVISEPAGVAVEDESKGPDSDEESLVPSVSADPMMGRGKRARLEEELPPVMRESPPLALTEEPPDLGAGCGVVNGLDELELGVAALSLQEEENYAPPDSPYENWTSPPPKDDLVGVHDDPREYVSDSPLYHPRSPSPPLLQAESVDAAEHRATRAVVEARVFSNWALQTGPRDYVNPVTAPPLDPYRKAKQSRFHKKGFSELFIHDIPATFMEPDPANPRKLIFRSDLPFRRSWAEAYTTPWDYYRYLDDAAEAVEAGVTLPLVAWEVPRTLKRAESLMQLAWSGPLLDEVVSNMGFIKEYGVPVAYSRPPFRHPVEGRPAEALLRLPGLQTTLAPAPLPKHEAAISDPEGAYRITPLSRAPLSDKDSQWYVIGPLCLSVVPGMFAKSKLNEQVALCNRHLARQNTPEEVARWKTTVCPTFEELCDFENWEDAAATTAAYALAGQIVPHYREWTMHQWLDTLDAERRAGVEKYLREQDRPRPVPSSKGKTNNEHYRKSFLKREILCPKQKLVVNASGAVEDVGLAGCAPRLIQGLNNPSLNMLLGPFAQGISEAWKRSCRTGAIPTFVYACGMTGEEIGRIHSQLMMQGYEVLESDFSKFDSTVQAGAYLFERWFYEYFRPDSEAQWALSEQHYTTGFTTWWQYRAPFGRKSGDQNTTVGNSAVNVAALCYAMQELGILEWRCIVMGDDNLVYYKLGDGGIVPPPGIEHGDWLSPSPASVAEAMSAHLIRLGLDPKVIAPRYPTFCSGEFYPLEVLTVDEVSGEEHWLAQSVLMPKITRKLCKFGCTVNKPGPGESPMMRLKGNELSNPALSAIPILRVVNAYYRGLSGEAVFREEWKAYLPSSRAVRATPETMEYVCGAYGVTPGEVADLEQYLYTLLRDNQGQVCFWAHPVFESMVIFRGL